MNDNGPSRGRKQCPGCKNYVGVRTTVCQCGHEFKNGSSFKPIASKIPVHGKPVVPVQGKPVIPVRENPVVPVQEKPVVPVQGKPVIPVRENPVVPVQEKPVVPVQVDTVVTKSTTELQEQPRLLPSHAYYTPENSAGRGRKQCPNCREYVGARTTQCQCGYDFQSETKPQKLERSLPALPKNRIATRSGIWTPSGSPPANLTGTSEEEVCEWAEKVFAHGRQEGKNYLVQALIYWIRYFYSLDSQDGETGSPEYRTVKSHLLNNYD